MKHETQSDTSTLALVEYDVQEWCDRLISAEGRPMGLPTPLTAFPGGVALGSELTRRGYTLGVSGAGWSARRLVSGSNPKE